jgi:predicted amidohydrolase YtcJ
MSESGRHGLTRRGLAKGAALAAGGLALGAETSAAHGRDKGGHGHDHDDDGGDLALVNGNIITLDRRQPYAESVAISDGRIVEVSRHGRVKGRKRTIDLKGATVVPGLIDSHQHFIRGTHNPGYETRFIESATSIADVQAALAARARTAPAGAFLTCIGGWNRNGLAERRLPTPAELDAAAPAHAVYLSETGGGGQAVTNTLGRAFFTTAGVPVDATTGVLAAGAGRAALVAVQTVADKRRGTREGIAHVSSLGMTTVNDVGGVLYPDYAIVGDLWRAGELDIRFRQFFTGFDFPNLDGVKNFVTYNHARLGDDQFRIVGIGERITSGSPSAATVAEVAQFLGERNWTLILHSLSATENQVHVDAYKTAAQSFDIAALRWQLHHINDITPALLAEVKALGIGVGIQGWRYTSNSGGAPWRAAIDLGIPTGGGTDATNVAAQNPWLMLYHMVTGRNNAGVITNAGQQVTRLEALRIYTEGSAYLTFDDHHLGTIEEGKLADVAVLSDNYLKVPEERIKKLTSNLTIQGGRIVHAAGRFKHLD